MNMFSFLPFQACSKLDKIAIQSCQVTMLCQKKIASSETTQSPDIRDLIQGSFLDCNNVMIAKVDVTVNVCLRKLSKYSWNVRLQC